MNSFEQFCINLCNETLQAQFIKVVFGVEQKIYVEQLGHELKLAIRFGAQILLVCCPSRHGGIGVGGGPRFFLGEDIEQERRDAVRRVCVVQEEGCKQA